MRTHSHPPAVPPPLCKRQSIPAPRKPRLARPGCAGSAGCGPGGLGRVLRCRGPEPRDLHRGGRLQRVRHRDIA